MKKIVNVFMTTALVATLFVGCSNQNTETSSNDNTAAQVTEETAVEETTSEEAAVVEEAEVEEVAEEASQVVYPYTYVDAAGREIVVEKEINRVAVD